MEGREGKGSKCLVVYMQACVFAPTPSAQILMCLPVKIELGDDGEFKKKKQFFNVSLAFT